MSANGLIADHSRCVPECLFQPGAPLGRIQG
jgi:hypothetical protein